MRYILGGKMKLSKINNSEIFDGQYIIDSEVEVLEKSVFSFCPNLEEIKIPDKIRVIPDEAFMYCVNLKKIDLNKVEKIGDYAFSGCVRLKEIMGLDRVVELGSYSLASCASVDKIKLSDKVNLINEGLFESCVNLQEAKFLNVEKIYSLAFGGCINLKEVIVTEKIKEIVGDAFFSGC